MKPPSALTQLAGTPFIALLLFGLYGAIILGCSQGHVPVWMAGITLMFAVATGNSVVEVRHYNRQMAAWESMGQTGGEEEWERRRRRPSWLSMLTAAALLVFIPTRQAPHDETLMFGYVITWLLSALYLVFAFLKLAWNSRRRKKAAARQTEAETASVEYLIGRPSSSPSVSEATRNLPDYAASILRRNEER